VTTASIPVFDVELGDAEVEAAAEALRSGWLTMGPRTEAFEAGFARHLGAAHAVAVSSGTAALHLAYLAAGVGPGDEVVVPAITFVATAAAVRYCGATPVLADVLGPHDIGVDPTDVEARLTERTKAVCAVHYAGYGADLGALVELCERRGLALVEDAAHSPSATLPGHGRLGTVGMAGAFSFFSNKILSCGEGGALVTDDAGVAGLARSLRSHALSSSTWDRHRGHTLGYDVDRVGFNYRLDEPRAALLTARLPGLEADIALRRRLVHRYRELLASVDGVSVPYSAEEVDRSSCYAMAVMVDPASVRDRLRARMAEQGVQTTVLYPALHQLSAYSAAAGAGLPRAEQVAGSQLTLPLYPHLAASDQERVVETLAAGLEALR
jgi:dTDP-4-amino-4,6-dideoxygalactose transaminase